MRIFSRPVAPLLCLILLCGTWPASPARAEQASFVAQMKPIGEIFQRSSQLLLRTFELDNIVFSANSAPFEVVRDAIDRERKAIRTALAGYSVDAGGLTSEEVAVLEAVTQRVALVNDVIADHLASQSAYVSASAADKSAYAEEHANTSLQRRRDYSAGQIIYNSALGRTFGRWSLTRRQTAIDNAMITADLALIDQEIARLENNEPASGIPFAKAFEDALGEITEAINLYDYVLGKIEQRGPGKHDPAAYAEIIAAREVTVDLYREALEIYREAGSLTWDARGYMISVDVNAVIASEARFLKNRAEASRNATQVLEMVNRMLGGAK